MASAMHLNVRSHGFSLTPAIRDYTERRLRFALSHAAGRVTSITVVLSDINGPRGGRDKCCRVRINVKDQQVMVVDDIQNNLYVAIDRAVDRAARAVSRRLGRLVNGIRHPRARRKEETGSDDATVPGDAANAH